jgi:D-sedoheptulose 7-phosphate isomerase
MEPDMDLKALYASEFADHATVMAATRDQLQEPFIRLVGHGVNCIRGGGKILFFGNGGSAADCQHLATELTIRYVSDRQPIAAIALTTDTSALTACGNDLGFDEIFARQIEALAKPHDLCIGISTSGNSENVIKGLIQAKTMGAVPAALGGKGGGQMSVVSDPYLVVPSDVTARIQEMHIMIGHMFCDALERELKLV